MRNIKTILSAVVFFLVLVCSVFSAEPTAADRGFAAEQFRLGVQSFYRGSYNDSILLFEKALSYLPNESKILEWLGNAYFQSGIEGAAINYWKESLEKGFEGDSLLMQNRIDTVLERRTVGRDFEAGIRFVESGSFPGKDGSSFYYSQPISALPEQDGSCWVLAYGSNEMLHFSANGLLKERVRGSIAGFDRPMDIIRQPDGNLLVTEYAGDRISQLTSDGKFIKSFGKKGRGNGELLGPQYMDLDASGNIYVTDFGNARVVVFSSEGEPLFTFGETSPFFKGFKAPSGIAVVDETVYVADAVNGGIYMFDTAGNYLDILVPENTFVYPESMKHWKNSLLVTDSNRIYVVNTYSGSILEAANTGNAPSKLTCAVPDANGNLLVTDFKSNEVFIMSKMSELVGGFFVQIERIDADKFPEVTVEVRVSTRENQPVLGLEANNFLITEGKRTVSNQRLTSISSTADSCDISIIIDRSISLRDYGESLQSAVRDIASSMAGKGTLHIISAGDVPVLEQSVNPIQLVNFVNSSLKTPASQNVSVDLAVRLAVNKLVSGDKKRAVVYITAGDDSSKSFDSYGLSDLVSYMNNNGVSFASVNLAQKALSGEIDFLTKKTGGSEYYVFRPDGLKGIVKDLIEVPVGSYQLKYVSSLPTNFGRSFLPIEVETYLLNRSGRAESGYFAPLE